MALPQRLATRVLGGLLDTLLPPRCLCCGGAVDRQGGLCAPCWSGLTFIAPPACACCGTPFDFALEGEPLCGACIAEPPLFARARAVLAYDDGSRPLVLGFKHGDRIHAAAAYGAWMARAGAELLADADLLAPVPLHRLRLFRRRYNQAALLAQAAGRQAGRPVIPDLLVRRRSTPSQGGLDRSGRRRNVQGAFAVRPGLEARVAGKRIVLVDDVLTTGATLSECARVLRRAGAERVDALTLARVVKT
ncbi:Competence protein F homolog, phosphoribosyltransferase domain; protein YhgH required for utilization of DNA as sole source of carbon and energy [Azospirillum argentinense]|uniref:ComF family protein n=1 Tax=Azospirillum argentinense TaxID=2970906 RepID=UPI0032DE8A8C